MAEVFYLGTVTFFVYVIYTVTYGDKQSAKAGKFLKTAKPKATTKASKSEGAKLTSAATVLVRNPETGETAAIPSNYRFAKRWIKETMVNEGLLDKVYSNIELDEENSTRVKKALEQFRALNKYKA